MPPDQADNGFAVALPPSLHAERRGEIAILRLSRPQKRNAIDDETVLGIETFFASLPADVKAIVVYGEGVHFSAGPDLGELSQRDIAAGIDQSRLWQRAVERTEIGPVSGVVVPHGGA